MLQDDKTRPTTPFITDGGLEDESNDTVFYHQTSIPRPSIEEFKRNLESMTAKEVRECYNNITSNQALVLAHELLAKAAKDTSGELKVQLEKIQKYIHQTQEEYAGQIAGISNETLDKTKGCLEKLGERAWKNLEEFDNNHVKPIINLIKKNNLGKEILNEFSVIFEFIKSIFVLIGTWVTNTLENIKVGGDVAANALNVITQTGKLGKQGVITGKEAATYVANKVGDKLGIGKMTDKISDQRKHAASKATSILV